MEKVRRALTDWSSVYEDFVLRHGQMIQIEGMEVRGYYQSAWVSRIKKIEEFEAFVKEFVRADWNNKQLNFFRKKYRTLPKIVLQAEEVLFELINELQTDFYNAEPKHHYSYL